MIDESTPTKRIHHAGQILKKIWEEGFGVSLLFCVPEWILSLRSVGKNTSRPALIIVIFELFLKVLQKNEKHHLNV